MNIQNKTYTTNDQIALNMLTEIEYLEKDESLHFCLNSGSSIKQNGMYNSTNLWKLYAMDDLPQTKLNAAFNLIENAHHSNTQSVTFFNINGHVYMDFHNYCVLLHIQNQN